jgi:LmbE family N-acetylglucosaminyl deacetylase
VKRQIITKWLLFCLALGLALTGCSIKEENGKWVPAGIAQQPILKSSQPMKKQAVRRLAPLRSFSRTVVYFVPHADDEVLTFGIPIRNDMAAGKQVYMVLFSAGEHSIAREVINGKYDKESTDPTKAGRRVYDKFQHRYHIPSQEGYHPLSVYSFGQVRINDFYRSAAALGIPRKNLAVYTLPNGHFPENTVKQIMITWLTRFPGATFKTMSAMDIHPDHAILGKVLNELYLQGMVKQKANYVSVATRMKYKNIKWPLIKLVRPADRKYILNAVQTYKQWDPKHGLFAVGYHSVPNQFDFLLKRMDTAFSTK